MDVDNFKTESFIENLYMSLKREVSNSNVWIRGEQLYKKGYIYELNVEEYANYYVVKGVIRSTNKRSFYGVLIEIDEDGNIDGVFSTDCTCKFKNSFNGLCKHRIAIGLAFLDICRGTSNLVACDKNDNDENVNSKTSTPLSNYLNKFRERSCEKVEDVAFAPVSSVSIIPELEVVEHAYYNESICYLKLRISCNNSKSYVVKNINELVYNISNNRYKEYGKQLQIKHSYDSLDEDSKELYDILYNVVHNDNSRDPYYSYTRSSASFPEVLLPQLLKIYSEKKLKVNGNLLFIKDENPKIKIFIRKNNNNSVQIDIPVFYLIYKSKDSWIYSNKTMYHCDEEFFSDVMTFFESIYALRLFNKDSNFIGDTIVYILNSKDYDIFCGNVLTKLSKHIEINYEDVDLTEHMPKEPEFSFYIEPLSKNFIQLNVKVTYGDKEYKLNEVGNEYRNIEAENNVKNCLSRYFEYVSIDKIFVCMDEDCLFEFVTHGYDEIQKFGEIFIDEKLKHLRYKNNFDVNVNLKIESNMIDVSVDSNDFTTLQMYKILSQYKLKKKYVRLKSGEFLSLDNGDLKILSDIYEVLNKPNKDDYQSAKAPLYRAHYLNQLLNNEKSSIKVKRSADYKYLINRINNFKDSNYDVPKSVIAKLRNYQKQGFRWLCSLTDCGLNGILADDMGLGKTLQVITLLNYFMSNNKSSKDKFKAIIVCPASLVYNWQDEFEKFSLKTNTCVVVGIASERNKLLNKSADVYIVSYDLLKRDIEHYKNLKFDFCIIDEAQYIKNAGTKAAKSVKSVIAKNKFALTGTPIENRLSDLWSIFDFLMPGYLFSHDRFRKEFEYSIAEGNDEVLSKLKRLVHPFILRRKKEDVLLELPEKIEQIQYVQLENEQQDLYKAQEQQIRMELTKSSDADFKKNKLHYLTMLTRLRQICCTPSLYLEGFTGNSAKVDFCLHELEQSCESGHKTLVFSQFKSMLEILAKKAQELELNYLFLSGGNTKEQRRDMIKDFQTGKFDVFFISLKAGGTGLNLTAADRVIHFDPWWNFAAEDQATDRTHRIGQKNSVLVKKLVAKNTIEERIVEMQENKRYLNDSIITGEGIANSKLNKEELLSLLQ